MKLFLLIAMSGLTLGTQSGQAGLARPGEDPASEGRGVACAGPEYTERARHQVRETRPERTLRIGDRVPALRVAEWTLGEPVERFTPGTAYVVIFVPSSNNKLEALFESVSRLKERFADEPVKVIGIGGAEEKTTLEAWRRKVEAVKGTVRFSLGWDRGVESRTAFLEAAGGQQPTVVFVVDKEGRLAWYGPPGVTSEILRPVLAGTWNLDGVRSEIEASEDLAWIRIEVIRAQRTKDLARFLKAGEQLTTEFGDLPSLEFAEALRDDLLEFGNELLQSDAVFDVKKETRLQALLLKASERAVKIDKGQKPRSLALYARACALNSDRAGALRSARRALELAQEAMPPDRDLIDRLIAEVAEYGSK